MDAGIGQFIPLILIFVIFYFFLIRPQQKKVKEHKAMVEALKRGDKVVTSGGIVGTVERVIDNEKVEVLISDNVKVEVVRSTGIQSLLNNTEQKFTSDNLKKESIRSFTEGVALQYNISPLLYNKSDLLNPEFIAGNVDVINGLQIWFSICCGWILEINL